MIFGSRRRNRPESGPEGRLERLAERARLALGWEWLWPPLSTAGAIIALFLAVSWGGLWLSAPRPARIAGLALFALAFLAALAPLVRWRSPTREAALRRLDRDSPDLHAPAEAFEDELANGAADEQTRALWALHRVRVAAEIQSLKVSPPSPGMAFRDPRALRYAALLLAVAGFLSAGSQRFQRFAAAFDFEHAGVAEAGERVDAWIDPPSYTGRPLILLKVVGQAAPETISAPEDSEIVLRAASADYDGAAKGAIAALATPTKPQSIVERRYRVQGDGEFRVTRSGSTLATFAIRAIPAGKPTVELIDPPKANASGSLALHYKIGDAYGVASAEAQFDSPEAGKHRLVEPPRFGLSLPNSRGGIGEGRTTGDLSEHPWAGADVTMRLSATDVAGRVGESDPIKLKLPQRIFINPLAKALVEIRRKLILDPDGTRDPALRQLAALRIAPDQFGTTPGIYLGLGAAHSRLDGAKNDADLLGVAQLLWAMALQIEDGDASQTLKDLRALEQKLRDALKNGASEEEIRKLTQELRELADRYMREMAENAKQSPGSDDELDAKDLDDMMNQLDQDARNGARDQAEAMLDELQDMFENMRGAQSAEQSRAEKEMRKQMGELGKLLRDQQALRDKTFKRDQKRRRAQPNGQPDQEQDQAGEQSLEQQQQALRDRLEEMKRKLKSLGMKGEQGLDDADNDMQDAERDMQGEGQGDKPGEPGAGAQGQGNGAQGRNGHTPLGDAVEAQGRALEALRKGADGLQKQMQANGQGKGGYRATMRGQGQRKGRDPLGRNSTGDRGASEGLLNEGPEAAARARQVQEELRRRLSDPNRAEEERDYLERLLRAE